MTDHGSEVVLWGTLALVAALLIVVPIGVIAKLVHDGRFSPPSRGTVIEKDYQDQAFRTVLIPDGSGAVFPYNIISPATRELKLRDGDNVGWIDVDRETYARYEIGDMYP